MFQDVKYDYAVNLAGTGDRSEYDIESYWKVVLVFQEIYGHRGSSEPASLNIIDLIWLDLPFHVTSHHVLPKKKVDCNRIFFRLIWDVAAVAIEPTVRFILRHPVCHSHSPR